MKRYLPFVIIGAVLLVALAGYLALTRRQSGDSAAPFVAAATPTPTVGSAGPAVSDQSRGPLAASQPGAPTQTMPVVPLPENIPAGTSVTIEEFGDYQCPPCGLLHPELKKITAEYGSKVNMVFRNFPLTNNHKNAQAAAQAAEAARLQGHFEAMHDRLYEHQDEWKDLADPRPAFTRYAREIGLDLNRYAIDVDGAEVQQRIAFDQQTAMARGVNGTPTVFIEGKQLKPEVTNLAGLRSGINIMLTRKAGAR